MMPTQSTTQEQHASAAFAEYEVPDTVIEVVNRLFRERRQARKNLESVIFNLGNGVYSSIEQIQEAVLPAYTAYMERTYPPRGEENSLDFF